MRQSPCCRRCPSRIPPSDRRARIVLQGDAPDAARPPGLPLPHPLLEAQDRCAEAEPELLDRFGHGHPSACHSLTPSRPREGRVARYGLWRSLVSALDWGSRGRRFKSSQPDHKGAGQSAAEREQVSLRSGCTTSAPHESPVSVVRAASSTAAAPPEIVGVEELVELHGHEPGERDHQRASCRRSPRPGLVLYRAREQRRSTPTRDAGREAPGRPRDRHRRRRTR